MGSKELAISDTAAEYTEGGTRLIESINEAHAGDRKMVVDKTKHAAQTLDAQMGGLALGLAEASEGVKKHCVAEMQKVSNSEEQKIRSQLEVAIAAHGN